MKNYCIVENETIVNIIVADADFAEKIGATPHYDGAAIGEPYSPPAPPPTYAERVEALEATVLAMMMGGV